MGCDLIYEILVVEVFHKLRNPSQFLLLQLASHVKFDKLASAATLTLLQFAENFDSNGLSCNFMPASDHG